MANALGLEGFSRIDAFVNVRSGEVRTSLSGCVQCTELRGTSNDYVCSWS
jgi:hypothetical protein